MNPKYIPRTLVADRGKREERTVRESDISTIDAPVVILGEPGLGKTELTKSLEQRFGYTRVPGGTFFRIRDVSRFALIRGGRIIIDGLDEVAVSSGKNAIDEVLGKLSSIENPKFILSCRSADWQGATDRYKIGQDYGVEPVTFISCRFHTVTRESCSALTLE